MTTVSEPELKRVSYTEAAGILATRDPYRPYRTVVAWYCWRAVELYAAGAESAHTR